MTVSSRAVSSHALVELVLLGPTNDQRQLQDSPVLGYAWIAHTIKRVQNAARAARHRAGHSLVERKKTNHTRSTCLRRCQLYLGTFAQTAWSNTAPEQWNRNE
jgi:hypothetical protein